MRDKKSEKARARTRRARSRAVALARRSLQRRMAGLAGHELLAGGCLSRCAARLPKRSREDEAAAAAGDASEAHVPRAKRLQRAAQVRALRGRQHAKRGGVCAAGSRGRLNAAQVVDQLHALNIVAAAGHVRAFVARSPVARAGRQGRF